MKAHFTEQYLLTPQHKVTINLVGLGGTGSQVLSALARMSEALRGLGHPGLHVYAYDHDTVSEANIGRQLFSPADLGTNKAVALITRINRFFGFNWEAVPEAIDGSERANITISCVDNIKARLLLARALYRPPLSKEPPQRPYYWLDFGNGQRTGQVVLGTVGTLMQPKSEQYTTTGELPNVVQLLPQIRKAKDEDSGPSCSLAEALSKQDLFINSTLCNLGMAMLWKLFREGRIAHHGCFLNLDTMNVNPINIK